MRPWISVAGNDRVNNGVATLLTSSLPLGTRLIVASYQGDANFAFSSNVMYQQVNTAPVTIYAATPTRSSSGVSITAFALDANFLTTTYTAPATVAITSGPGSFVNGFAKFT